MRFAEIFGQDRVIQQLQTAHDSGRMHHAMLLCGQDGIGKRTLGKVLANLLLCELPTQDGPCLSCGSCHRFSEGNHADFIAVGLQKKRDGTEEKMIKVDQIRTVQRALALKSFEGGYRVLMITDADRMNPSTANALLKTLEEPPPKTIFILTTNAANALLPTVISRCQTLRLSPLSADALTQIAQKNFTVKAEELVDLVNYADGSASRLVHLMENEVAEVRDTMIHRLSGLSSGGSPIDVLAYAEQDAADKKRMVPFLMLDLLQQAYRERLATLVQTNPSGTDTQNTSKRGLILNFLARSDMIRGQLRTNQRNPRIAMEEIWFLVAEIERQA